MIFEHFSQNQSIVKEKQTNLPRMFLLFNNRQCARRIGDYEQKVNAHQVHRSCKFVKYLGKCLPLKGPMLFLRANGINNIEEPFCGRIGTPNKTYIFDTIFKGYDKQVSPYYRGKNIFRTPSRPLFLVIKLVQKAIVDFLYMFQYSDPYCREQSERYLAIL